ncbi:MAG: hypothetical protein PHT79_04425 [Syntrophomonadaceae bacterium]|nr:hypothetical protein [Syntrophomonadaceae bacterium]MDD3890263.1 hypothetical protein [Syntrophomonadaceae bacterium]MDD4548987.1 hypothetical protein [Syntrophomonadaceae bacterium]
MIKNIKVNLEEIESMLYFWHATGEKEKVGEVYLNDVAAMPGLSACYDDEFNAESVRKVLSAITNREMLSEKTKKEGRFWNNNMWMTEDLEFTDMMVKPLKLLNLESLVAELQQVKGNDKYEKLEVVFSPLHFDEYIIKDNKVIINFFRVKPDDFEETVATIDGKDIKEYIKEKLVELLQK